jgi:hypothetical protein
MSAKQPVQFAGRGPQAFAGDLHGSDRGAQFWLTSREAAAYVGSASVKAFYDWRRRHGVVALGNGRVSRRDLDKALAVPRKRHQMSPVSLANLRRRHGQQSARSAVSASSDALAAKG